MESSPQKSSAGSIVEVWRNGKQVATLRPHINVFGDNPQRIPTPSVLYTPWHDLYLSIVGDFEADQSYTALRVVQSPLVTWIWLGGFIVVLGTLYALSPQRRALQSREIEGVQRA
jgi:cytochrome c-type biogenesis protein CcmF